jgi:hypothetical protein
MTHPPHVSRPDAPSDEKTWSPILVPLHAQLDKAPNEEIVDSASIPLHAHLNTTFDKKKVASTLVPLHARPGKVRGWKLESTLSSSVTSPSSDGKTGNTEILTSTSQSFKQQINYKIFH